MIIVEGVDNTGKTTLIKQLKERFPLLEVVKSPGPSPELGRWVCAELLQQQPAKTKIYDRFFFSEFVYGPVLRDSICFSDRESKLILGLLHVAYPLIVICYRNVKDSLKTFNDREQMEGVENKYLHLVAGYQTVVEPMLEKYGFSYITHNFANSNAFEDEVVPRVARHLKRRTLSS